MSDKCSTCGKDLNKVKKPLRLSDFGGVYWLFCSYDCLDKYDFREEVVEE